MARIELFKKSLVETPYGGVDPPLPLDAPSVRYVAVDGLKSRFAGVARVVFKQKVVGTTDPVHAPYVTAALFRVDPLATVVCPPFENR